MAQRLDENEEVFVKRSDHSDYLILCSRPPSVTGVQADGFEDDAKARF
jgi:hypothetical protein